MAFLKFVFCVCCCLGTATDTKPPLIADLDRDVTAFYKRFQDGQTDRAKMNAIVDMCQLHNLIWSDPRYSQIEKLRGMRNKIVFQLKAAEKHIGKSLGLKAKSNSKQRAAGDPSGEIVSPGNLAGKRTPTIRDSLVDALLMSLPYAPGPDQIAVHAGSFGGGDYSPELIALIQSTIHPEHWDINGGPGHIHYYRPVMALVIRAGSEVHDQTADLLQRLRENGQ